MSSNRLDITEVEIDLDAGDSAQLVIKQTPKLMYQIHIKLPLSTVLLR